MNKKNRYISGLLAVALGLSVTAGSFTSVAATEQPVTQLVEAQVGHQTNPIGIEQNPIFSWKMQSKQIGASQQAYQIVVHKGNENGEIVWDTGKQQDTKSTAIQYNFDGNAKQLEPQTRYYWTATVWDQDGKTSQTEPAYFETGCNWDGASWITIQNYEDGMDSLLFRTEQKLSGKEVASARLYITGLGDYEAYINGKEVQGELNSILAPGWTDYSSYTHYQTYDVTDYFANDDQTVTLGAIVGTGWYDSALVDAKANGYAAAIGDEELMERCLYAKMVITYADNTTQEIVTDNENWKASSITPYEEDGIYEGETFNASVAADLEGWNQSGYDVSNWSSIETLQYKGNVTASDDGIIYDYQELPMESAYSYNTSDIITADAGSNYAQGEIDFTKANSYQPGDEIHLKAGDTLIADFGQNASATVALQVSAPAGTKISMQPGECLSDGKDGSFTKGTLIPGACAGRGFRYIASGEGVESYRAQFHFTGYQYLEIKADQDITLYNLSSMAVSSIDKETGFIETSDELLNQFISNSKWSQVSNFNSVPTDCPTREYYGWSGDAQLFAESAMYHFDSANFLGNYIDIMNDFYNTYGVYGNIMPMHTNSFFNKLIGAGWADASIIIPWVYYQQTGDLSFAKTYWKQMTEYTDKIAANGHSYSLGDWCGIGESSGTPFTANAYNILINDLMSKMAKALGYQDQADKYAQNAESKRQETIEKYVTPEGDVLCASADGGGEGYVDNAQTALAWAIKLKLYHTEEQKQAILSNLAASVENENQSVSTIRGENTLSTGFLGVNVLLPALSETSNSGTAYNLMTNDDMYTFLYSAAHGATTIWERWDIWTEENGYDTSNVSQNHYSYGAASEWLYEYAAGIQKDEENPGFKHFILQPEVDDSLSYLNGSYDSYYGKIVSNWKADQGELTSYETVVPANTTATLYLPVSEQAVTEFTAVNGVHFIGMEEHNGKLAAKFELQAGGYHFAVKDGKLMVSIADGYVVKTNKSILDKVIAYAETQQSSPEFDNVIADVQKSFTQAFENAKTVSNNVAASQEEVDTAWQTLLNEIHKLGFVKGDISSLESLVALAETYDMDDYVEAGQAEFQEALKAAQDLLANKDNAMAEEIETAENNLLNAMLNLRYKADKSILEEVLAEANKVDANAYTAESYAALQAAVAEASDVYNNENATQEEVDAAVTSVQTAMDKLVAVDGTPAETPTEGNDTAGTQTGQESTTPKANAAKTGDFAPIAGMAALAIASGVLLFTRKKK
ncbi:family 78 glycoside hydrolase catalytic domain [Clostridium facile]|uniref:alpha-L-rhamnosidase n=1 Tax=Clostridium facile TaxID=2763035 RepID=A0ABR7IPC5_9CLOT|nr:family 78 glycoside hydrolase catalytic domain [Clostridium facile]MBC5786990.1 family 78 glycoside hydrolase catalytic domain [Clostridium facile]